MARGWAGRVGVLMRILAIDLLNLFRRNWEAPDGNTNGVALLRTRNTIDRFRTGFDVVAICSDAHPCAISFRQHIEPSYKASRTDPGPQFGDAHQVALAQMGEAGFTVFVAPQHEDGDYHEAEDVIASMCVWACHRGHSVRIMSSDKDLAQLVSVASGVSTLVDIQGPDGNVLDQAAITAKIGIAPRYVPDWLALAGDASDGYKPFPGPMSEGRKRRPGIGDKTAVGLIRDVLADEMWCAGELGARPAFAVFDLLGLDDAYERDPPRLTCGPSVKKILRGHGVEAAARGLALATLRRDVPIDFSGLERYA